jgi:hypothetical protein
MCRGFPSLEVKLLQYKLSSVTDVTIHGEKKGMAKKGALVQEIVSAAKGSEYFTTEMISNKRKAIVISVQL